MRILYLNHNVAWAGTFQRASNLAREFAARGDEVTLVTTSRTARFAPRWSELGGARMLEAPDLWWGPARSGWDPWNTARRILSLSGLDFDLIHAFDCRPAVIFPALALRRRTGATLFIDWADWWGRGGRIQERSGWAVRTFFGPLETWFEEAFRHHAAGTTVISSALERRAMGLGIAGDRIARFPDGCDLDGVTPVPHAEARSRLSLAGGGRWIVHLGVLTPGDMALLAGAFRAVRERIADAHLLLVGERSAPLPPDLARSPAVRRAGFVEFSELELWLGAADLCVIAMQDTVGNRGRWPGKLSCYLSAGRPTVMSRVGDAAPLLEEHGAGWAARPEPDALGERIVRALSDADALDAAGRRARRLAEGRLSWAGIGDRLERFYRSVRSGAGAGRNAE